MGLGVSYIPCIYLYIQFVYLSDFQKSPSLNLVYAACTCTCTYIDALFLAQVKVVVFDKTGTLTYGRPEVNCVILTVSETTLPLQAFLAIVGLAESFSEHPLGMAISSFAKRVSNTCANEHISCMNLYSPPFLNPEHTVVLLFSCLYCLSVVC